MTIKIPLKRYLERYELEEGDTILCPCYPHIGEFVKEAGDDILVRMKGDYVYGKGSEGLFGVDKVFIPIDIQKFHILDKDDSDIKNL